MTGKDPGHGSLEVPFHTSHVYSRENEDIGLISIDGSYTCIMNVYTYEIESFQSYIYPISSYHLGLTPHEEIVQHPAKFQLLS